MFGELGQVHIYITVLDCFVRGNQQHRYPGGHWTTGFLLLLNVRLKDEMELIHIVLKLFHLYSLISPPV